MLQDVAPVRERGGVGMHVPVFSQRYDYRKESISGISPISGCYQYAGNSFEQMCLTITSSHGILVAECCPCILETTGYLLQKANLAPNPVQADSQLDVDHTVFLVVLPIEVNFSVTPTMIYLDYCFKPNCGFNALGVCFLDLSSSFVQANRRLSDPLRQDLCPSNL